MWGSTFRGYSHGLDLSIREVDDHPLTVVIAIQDRLVKSQEYIDYPLSDKAFMIYLKMNLKNKRHNLKVWIEYGKEHPKTCTPMHWENMKVMIRDPFKVEEVA